MTASFSTLTDGFDTGVDPAKWVRESYAEITSEGLKLYGYLNFETSNGSDSTYLPEATFYDLADGPAKWEVIPSDPDPLTAHFGLHLTRRWVTGDTRAGAYFRITDQDFSEVQQPGKLRMFWTLYFPSTTEFYNDEHFIDYDATAHRWLRIRQDESKFIHFETSPDNITWTDQFVSSREMDYFAESWLSANTWFDGPPWTIGHASLGTFVDEFTAPFDLSKWKLEGGSWWENGHVQIGASNHGWIKTADATRYSLYDASISAKFTFQPYQTTTGTFSTNYMNITGIDYSGLDVTLSLQSPTEPGFHFYYSSADSSIYENIAIPFDLASIPYLYLRLSQTTDSVVHFSTSLDGITWSEQAATPPMIGEFTDCSFGAGSYDAPFQLDDVNGGGGSGSAEAVSGFASISQLNTAALAPVELRGYITPHWTVGVGPWSNVGPDHEINDISGRRLTVKRTAPDEFTFSVLGDSDQASFVHELRDDVWVYRNGVLLARNRIHNGTDNVGNSYDAAFTSLDYTSLLDRRFINLYAIPPGNANYTFINDQVPEDIIRWLIDHVQAQPGMYLPITYGSWGPLGLMPVNQYTADGFNYTVQNNQNVLSVIKTMTELGPGFDFWIDPQRRANVALFRGKEAGDVLDYGGAVNNFTRRLDSKDFANYLSVKGEPLLPYTAAAPNVASAPEGGWADVRSAGDRVNAPGTAARGQYELEHSKDINNLYTYTCELAHGYWKGPEHIWVGDTVCFIAKRGRIDVRRHMRVEEISIEIDQNDTENVSMTLNLANNPKDALRKLLETIRTLQIK